MPRATAARRCCWSARTSTSSGTVRPPAGHVGGPYRCWRPRPAAPTAPRSATPWPAIEDAPCTTSSIDARPYPLDAPARSRRVALIMIDMQRDFLEPGGFGETLGNDVSRLAACIEPAERLLEGFAPRRHCRSSIPANATAPTFPTARRRNACAAAGPLRIGDPARWGASWSRRAGRRRSFPALAPAARRDRDRQAGQGRLLRDPLDEAFCDSAASPISRRRRDHRSMRPDDAARSQRPRLRLPARRGRDGELLPAFKQASSRWWSRSGDMSSGWTATVAAILEEAL